MSGTESHTKVVFDLSAAASAGLLEAVRLNPEDYFSGGVAPVSFVLEFDYAPDDPIWYQSVDMLTPDRIGFIIEGQVSAGPSISTGMSASGSGYPGVIIEEYIDRDNITVQGYWVPINAQSTADGEGQLLGVGVGLGSGYGLDITVSAGARIGIFYDFGEFELHQLLGDELERVRILPTIENYGSDLWDNTNGMN